MEVIVLPIFVVVAMVWMGRAAHRKPKDQRYDVDKQRWVKK